MKTSLKLEELAQFLFGLFLFTETSYPWWYFPAFILLPDIGMLGYLVSTKLGALCYNLFHHKAIALGILTLGLYLHDEFYILVGIILFSHAALDRTFGYGLKYPDSFNHTHLGRIGREK